MARLGWMAITLAAGTASGAALDPVARPAERLPRAAQAAVLDVVRVGTGFVAAGARGHLLASADGEHWTQRASPLRTMFTRLVFRNGQQGCAFGHEAAVVCSQDGGKTWAQRHYAPSNAQASTLHDARVLATGEWLAVGAFGLMLKSRDDGASWQRIDNALTALGYHFNALRQLADGRLLIAGERGLLASSVDGGMNWTLAASPYSGSFFGMQPLGNNGVLLYGQRGRVYVVDDLARLKPGTAEALDPLASTGLDDSVASSLGFRRLAPVSSDSLFGGAALARGGWLLVGAEGAVVEVDPAAQGLRLLSREAATSFSAVLDDAGEPLVASGKGVRRLKAATTPK